MAKIKRSDLERLSKEELLAIAKEAQKIKEASKFKSIESYWDTAHQAQIDFHKAGAEYRIRYFSGGNRCLIDSSLVSTVDGEKSVADIQEPTFYVSLHQKLNKFQFSLGGAPFPKAKENLYRVIHERGEVVCSALHQILCADGEYRSAATLCEGQSVLHAETQTSFSFPHRSNSEFFQSKSREDDLSFFQKHANYLDDYGFYTHQCGRQLQLEEECVEVLSRLSVDVPKFFEPFYRLLCELIRDFRLPLQERIRLCRDFDLLCSFYSKYPSEAQSEISSLARKLLGFFGRTSLLGQSLLQFDETFEHRHTEEKSSLLSALYLSSESLLPAAPYPVKILYVEKLKKSDWVWDLRVLGTNNYVSGGLINHNSGKSTAGFVEDLMLSLGIHPHIKNKVPNRGYVVVQDYENAAKNILEVKLNEWCPPGEIEKIERNQSGAIRRVFFRNGSTWDVLSHDQDMKVFEGFDGDWAHFDEPPPKHIYTAVWRGLTDRGGIMHMTATPLASPWLYQEYKKAIDGDTLRWFRFVKTTENALNIGEGDKEKGLKRIEEFGSLLSEDEKAARLDGMMVQMQGLIFKEWKKEHHVIPPFDIPYNWHIWETIDPHPHKPWAICWIAVTETGHKILIRSLMAQGTLDEIADQILYEREQIPTKEKSRPRVVRCIIDNSSSVPLWQKSNHDPTIGRISVREELENYIGPNEGGPVIEVAPKNVAQKIDLFRRWLKIDDDGNSVFYVFDVEENERFIFEIENYVWDSSRSKGMKNTPKKENDDCLDAVMQVALSLPKDAPDGDLPEPVRIWENSSWTVR